MERTSTLLGALLRETALDMHSPLPPANIFVYSHHTSTGNWFTDPAVYAAASYAQPGQIKEAG